MPTPKNVPCPDCGGNDLVGGVITIRQNGTTGRHFLGCSNWPHCEWTDSDVGEYLCDEGWYLRDQWKKYYLTDPRWRFKGKSAPEGRAPQGRRGRTKCSQLETRHWGWDGGDDDFPF